MLETLAAESATLQNVYAPLPFKVHFIFCIIATLLYMTQFMRKRSVHYLIIMVAIDLTIVTQFCTESIVIAFLFGIEVILLALAGIFSHKYNKAQAKLQSENAATADNSSDSADNDSKGE
ncbi:hypothetical protein [Ruminococcus sp.]|uniref:hypothetical protein n=1 Tax=Ruminococcus sp. TaxID=41978 RepID=UPI0025FDC1C4|nr:hypothetical protein [Ruminococcus sp.]